MRPCARRRSSGGSRSSRSSFPEAYEDRPWGDFPVFKVGQNKVFGWMVTRDDSVDVTLKLTAEERDIAHLLPYVRTASHVGRYGWVTRRSPTRSRSSPRWSGYARATGSSAPLS
jgi:predicted DNA-binding protein (MmcQ/YjbR family)